LDVWHGALLHQAVMLGLDLRALLRGLRRVQAVLKILFYLALGLRLGVLLRLSSDRKRRRAEQNRAGDKGCCLEHQ
jgi:hypothetical protein